MININVTGIILGSVSFILILALWYLYEEKLSKNKISDLDKRLNKIEEEEKKKKEEETKDGNFIDRLQEELNEGEIKLNIFTFILIFAIATVLLFLVAYSIFKQPLVALSPLVFTTYFVPVMIIEGKKKKVLTNFETELVIVLRRMSSVLQSGSILQALIEVKDLKNLSYKMRVMLNEIHHNIKYGDSIEEAFYKSSKDIKSEHLKLAVVSIDLNKELGADLANSLNEISNRIQKSQLMEKEAKSLMASTVMIGKFLSFIPFIILGYIGYSSPDYFTNYLLSISNQIVFMAMIFVMFLGIFIINKGGSKKKI